MADSAEPPKKSRRYAEPLASSNARGGSNHSTDRLDRIRTEMVKRFHELTLTIVGEERRVLANMIIEDLKVAATDWSH